jgi:C_GCAxxG_C_C family probable redox protein
VLLAVCQQMNVDDPAVPRIATAFGGGIGGRGQVCGAVAGAVMAIGLTHGRHDASGRDADAYRLTQELTRRFEDTMGALECRALTGMDLSTREGVKAFYASDVPAKVCSRAVRTAYEVTIDLLAAP